MFKVTGAQRAPIEFDGYWTQDLTLYNDGEVAVTAYYPQRPAALFEDNTRISQAGIIVPGFLESRHNLAIRTVAAGLAKANTTVLTVDPRGIHDSNRPDSRYQPRQLVADVANLAALLAPTERLTLGGQSMGGVFALRAAVLLQGQAAAAEAGDAALVATDVFTVKTPHVATAHEPFAQFQQRATRRGIFFGINADGTVVRERVYADGEAFAEHAANSDVGLLAKSLGGTATRILLTASPEDTELPREPLQALAGQLPHVIYADVAGKHSDCSPEAAATTASVIGQWYQVSP